MTGADMMANLDRYFFDVDCGAVSYTDEYGVELLGLEDARLEAFGLIAALMKDRRTLENGWAATVTVRDGGRQPIYEVNCHISGRDITAGTAP